MKPALIAHGGAWDWDDAEDEPKQAALHEAVSAGYAVLTAGGSALDAVEQTAVFLENHPLFDAGTGGYLNQAGLVQLDALIVDGRHHDFGAVGGVTRVKNPITLARKIMTESDHCFFVGAGADEVATKLGIPLIDNGDLVTSAMRAHFAAQRRDGPSDTIGAVAMDAAGNMAAATSTSGTPFKPNGRVGDSPIYGAGGYALNGVGTVGTTGQGENIMRTLLAKYTADRLAEGLSAREAARVTMRYIDTIFQPSMAGVIVIDKDGSVGAAHTTPKLAIGWVDEVGEVKTAVRFP